MELKWLEDFLSLAQTRSFSRSASERFCTQSAFSRRIKALETWLGVPLINRSTFPTALTPAGIVFRDATEEILRLLYEVRDDLRGHLQPGSDAIQIYALHAISVVFFPRWLEESQQRLGRFDVRLTPDNLHNCVRALVEGGCDLMFTYAHPAVRVLLDAEHFPSVVLATEMFLPVSQPDTRGRPRFRLPGNPKQPIPYLAYGPNTFLGQAVEFVLKRHADVSLHCCYENPMADGLRSMVRNGLGVGWLPESLIANELKRGELVIAGDAEWQTEVEVRLYRSVEHPKSIVESIWSSVS
jgi:LysR family transcriptional regulator, hypochlorite-specific transcription factor HypT